eukprot:TRINITY_DN3129_c0_g1_i2.p1 TRINITY_DN3129_c0_g1~~TRINITY_DN3129_c0_g1_i2.p1  ORF type:complete len:314 (-),score=44.36 TRINITY_DN3129_c0_g1_i2:109-1050(-)
MAKGKGLVLKLCSSNSDRILEFVATEDSPVDVGTISRCFRLNPMTVKFNGIYVSRSNSFISCVTWGTLLSCFARKGLPLGDSLLSPVVVEGKSSPDSESSGECNNDCENERNNLQTEVTLPGNKRAWSENPGVVCQTKRSKITQKEDELDLAHGFDNKRHREDEYEGMTRKHIKLEHHLGGCNNDCENERNNLQTEVTLPGNKRAWSENPGVVCQTKRPKNAQKEDELELAHGFDNKRHREDEYEGMTRKHIKLEHHLGNTFGAGNSISSAQQTSCMFESCDSSVLPLNCNSQLRKHSISDEIFSVTPYKRAR